MDPEACHTLHDDKGCVREHHHCAQDDITKEVADLPLLTRKKLSTEGDPGPLGAAAIKYASVSSDLDGGYGWVIVTASFFVAFIVDGVGSSFGLLFPYILAKFKTSTFVASFAGSLFVAFLIMGSISIELVKRFGFRAVTVTGSVLSCVAFLVSAFSPNIYLLMVTYGLLAGCSCGLVFIPSVVIVNEYFHGKRGIANGIITSGSGVGLLVLAPIINHLLDTYLLDGTIILLSGVLLNMCVFASLFRPPRQSLRHAVSVSDECDKDYFGHPPVESLSSDLSTDSVDHYSVTETSKSMLQRGQDKKKQRTRPGCFHVDLIIQKYCQVYLQKTVSDLSSCAGQGEVKSTHFIEYMLDHLKSGVLVPSRHPTLSRLHGYRYTNQEFRSQHRLHKSTRWRSEFNLDFESCQPIGKQHRVYSMYNIPTSWRPDKDWHKRLQNMTKSHRHLGCHDDLKHEHPHRGSRHHSQSLSIDHGSNLYLAGSISTLLNLHNSFMHTLQESIAHSPDIGSSKLPNFSAFPADYKTGSHKLLRQDSNRADAGDPDKFVVQINGYGEPVNLWPTDLHVSIRSIATSGYSCLAEEEEDTDSCVMSAPSPPQGYTISQLMCMPSFHLFCLGASLIQVGYPLAGTYLANYAYQFDLTTSHTAILMGLLGGLNICGRLLAGAMVSLKADPLLLNNMSLLLGGVACLMSPLYTEFWSLCVFASMFGFFLGFFPPLQPLIIVKHFGLDSLASAFGFLSTVKGVASILGAPLAGYIYDATGQYSMSFMFGGAVFVLSSLVHCLMAWGSRCRNQKVPGQCNKY